MSIVIKDGGPAFPIPLAFNPNSGEPQNTGMYWDGNGMSLRAYFAGQAISGLLGDPSRDTTFQGFARDAVRFADALIAELYPEATT